MQTTQLGEKQSQNRKNSTKGGFSFAAIIPIINILPKKKKKSTVARGKLSFWMQKRKQASSRKGITPKIKFTLGEKKKIVTIPSPTLPCPARAVVYTALLGRELSLGSSGKEPREGEKGSGTERRGERKRKWRRD